jgi:hypothetical protein
MTELDQAAFGTGIPDQAGESYQAGEPAETPPPPTSRSDRSWLTPLAVIAGMFLILMIAATAAVALTGPSTPSSASGTPGAAIQSWASAMQAHDYATADTYLSTSLKSQGVTSRDMLTYGDLVNVTIDSVSIQGDSAVVEIHLTAGSKSDSTYNFTIPSTVSMIRESDGWKIDSTVGSQSL